MARPAHGRGRNHDDDVSRGQYIEEMPQRCEMELDRRRGEPAHEPIAVGAHILQHYKLL